MMKLVIDISEEDYTKIKDSINHNAIYCDLYLLMQKAIAKAVPLSKDVNINMNRKENHDRT